MNSRITCIECVQPIPLYAEVRVDGLFYCVKCAPKKPTILERIAPEGFEDKKGFHFGKPPTAST